jgi:hypothetical protein
MSRPSRAIFLILAVLAAPVFADDVDTRAVVGGGLGGALGAFIGSELGGRNAAILGGGLGAAAGTAIATEPYPRYDEYRGRYDRDRHCPPGLRKQHRCGDWYDD